MKAAKNKRYRLRFYLALAIFIAPWLTGCTSTADDAAKKARSLFEQYWTQTSNSWVTLHQTQDTIVPGWGVWANYAICDARQVRNVQFRVQENHLEEADRLNGIQWSGMVYVVAKAERRHSNIGWSEWRDSSVGDITSFSGTKLNGNLSVAFSTFSHFDFQNLRKPSSEDIQRLMSLDH